MTTSEWRWVVLCMIKCGYIVQFLPPIHRKLNAYVASLEVAFDKVLGTVALVFLGDAFIHLTLYRGDH